jgi:hypothetical protein
MFLFRLVLAITPLVAFALPPLSGAQSRPSNNVRVTVIGCVQPWRPSSALAPSATPPADVKGVKYMLSNITLTSDADRVKGGAERGASGAVAEAVKSYRLEDGTGAAIPPYVGHRVEVTGVVVSRAESPGPPILHVESVKDVAAGSTACGQ